MRVLFFVWLIMAGLNQLALSNVIPTGIPDSAVAERLRTTVATQSEAMTLWKEVLARAEAYLGTEPQPVEEIFYERLLDTDPRRVATVQALYDMRRIEAWLSAWLISEDDRFQSAAMTFIMSWVRTYVPTGNPINENKLDSLLTAAAVFAPVFAHEDRELLYEWLEAMAEAQIGSKETMPWSVRNNWHPKRIKIVAVIAQIVGRDDWRNWVLAETRNYIQGALFADGSSRDFKQRDALSYHIGGLRPLLRLIALCPQEERLGLYSWESESGSSIAKSVEFLLPYFWGEKQHEEFRNTTVSFDRWRASEGLTKYQPGNFFNPKQAISLFQLAAAFDGRYRTIITEVLASPEARLLDWTGVLADSGWLVESIDREFSFP
ncbi:MAG: alginate lyase family protein [Verrucomicrobia bacterium]|nr:alginate lyase family protein [Verrucomicrobiota bacterium]